ncbi:hypothetical protein SLS56_009483 [Neofusicoccum ribis]|uniref:Xylanolytic transcriptional activator regulatory domain-containing protein n=1 Tax=Neofusicoccum ribis TaxID=45134 RepID=A0ABR3SIQ5_9PEZI
MAADTSEVVVKDASNECSHHDAGDSATLEATLQSNPWNHGDCLLDFFEFEIEMHRKSPPDPPPQPDPPGEPRGLQARMQEAVVQLSKTHASMARDGASDNAEFDWCLAESVFTVDNLRDFEWAYFHRIHRHNSVIHRPTFDCEKVSLPLLLAVFLFGSVYSAPLDSALSARYFFECAEEYIYTHPTFRSLVDDLPTERGTVDEIQVLQAAVTIQTLQYGVNNKTTRRRIRVERHPHLVTAVRSAGFFQAKHGGPPTSWEDFIRTETLVRKFRISVWTFLGDGFQAAFYNSPPMIALSELFGSLPCPESLFEAESACEFQQLVCSRPRGPDPHSPSEFVSFLFHDTWPGPKHDMYSRLTADHLLVIVMASDTIVRAADRWKLLWDSVVGQDPEQQRLQGFAKHAPELFWLTRAILHVAQSGDKSHGYMRGIVTDTLHEVHDFIRRYQNF